MKYRHPQERSKNGKSISEFRFPNDFMNSEAVSEKFSGTKFPRTTMTTGKESAISRDRRWPPQRQEWDNHGSHRNRVFPHDPEPAPENLDFPDGRASASSSSTYHPPLFFSRFFWRTSCFKK